MANEVALPFQGFAMTRMLTFDSPYLLGFEHTRVLIERAAKAAAESYPPYNVEETGEGRVRITLAVAGFSPDQLQVTVDGDQLTVSGRKDGEVKAETGERAYLHRGIAARGFLRTFVLARGMEVVGALLEHGLLHVDLARPDHAERIKQIPIRSAG
jgi:HSP20 family molecular chaperone IbpA